VIGPKPGKAGGGITGRDKTSILFGTPHVPGALQRALAPFAEAGLNLMRIESFPMRDRMWEYLFFADFAGHAEEEKTRQCLHELEGRTAFLKILGSYPRGIEENPL
jgi:chorismate mutase/prephenate dehydratase